MTSGADSSHDSLIARKVPVQERARSTVESIVAATARVLSEEGFGALTTNRVAEAAGVNIATLYRYFSAKEDLVAALWAQQCERMLAIMEQTAEAMGSAPVGEAIRHYVAGLLRFHAEDPSLHHELRYAVAALGVENPPELDERERALLRSYLEAHRAHIVPEDLDLATFVLVSTVDHLTNDACLQRPELLRGGRLEDEIVALVAGYLLGPRGR